MFMMYRIKEIVMANPSPAVHTYNGFKAAPTPIVLVLFIVSNESCVESFPKVKETMLCTKCRIKQIVKDNPSPTVRTV